MTTQEKLSYLINNNLINTMDAISYAQQIEDKDRPYIAIQTAIHIDQLYEKYTKKG